jgi:transposase
MTATPIPQVESVTARLYVAFELSKRTWMLAMTSGFGVEPWVRTLEPQDWAGLTRELARARERFGLPASAPVISCYEAGRDGFWIHHALLAQGVANRVVDSASIEVNRRARHLKTDRIDAKKLVSLLVRVCLGETGAWREVRVPSLADEAARHRSRERQTVVQERTRLRNQVQGYLMTVGTRLPKRRRGAWWTTVRDWSGAALSPELQVRVARTWERLELVEAHLRALDEAQHRAVAQASADSAAGRLRRLKGVAATSIRTLLDEGLVWRAFTNRRQIGAMLGFAPVRSDSGDQARDVGISRAGNPRWQTTAVQLAWNWVRWQPQSALTTWYRARFGQGRRARRVGIVALARKLMITLWRYVTTGTPPTGVILTVA